jgi:ubiquilin
LIITIMPLIAVNIRVNDRRVAVNVDTVKTISEFKEAIQASEINISKERQKLIYSGRVLKDEETVESYGIQNGQTVHLVQTHSPQGLGAGTSTSTPPPQGIQPQQQQQQQQIPTNLASGAGAFNPFAGLTGARYAGQVPLPNASLFGPDPGNQLPPSPEQMEQMMNQPGFQQAMSQVLSDPRMVDYLIQTQPQLQQMGPGIRQVMQSEEFRRTMTDPTTLRSMFEMNRMFQQMGMQVPGMPGGARQPSFPAPGVTNTTAPNQQTGARTGVSSPPPAGQQQAPVNPFESMFSPPVQGQGTNPNTPNPFMALFNQPYASPPLQQTTQQQPGQQQQTPSQHQPQQGLGAQSPPLNAQQPPFGNLFAPPQQQQSPPAYGQTQQPAPAPDIQSMMSMLQNMQSMFGQGGTAGNPLAGGVPNPYMPAAAPAAPADTRPLEERYQDQLRQLNEMGFTDYSRNIAALRRTGGNVEAAIEMLISGTV